jgi:hypothetical protein
LKLPPVNIFSSKNHVHPSITKLYITKKQTAFDVQHENYLQPPEARSRHTGADTESEINLSFNVHRGVNSKGGFLMENQQQKE